MSSVELKAILTVLLLETVKHENTGPDPSKVKSLDNRIENALLLAELIMERVGVYNQ